jgi:hypothetical protein
MEGNVTLLEIKYQMNYGTNLIAAIANFPEQLEGSRKIFESVGKNSRDELDSGYGSLIHGDFWSGK